MATIYDGNGNAVSIEQKFGVKDYATYDDGTGELARQGLLTYEGKKLYPLNQPAQQGGAMKMYNGGVMFALGDSYTAMGKSYFAEFATKHGLVCDNRGVGSSTIAGTGPGMEGTVGFQPFWVRLDAAIAQYQAPGGYTLEGKAYTPDDVKLVIFMGGTNDWYTVDPDAKPEPIDRIGNPKSKDKTQLYGAAKYCFQRIVETFTSADVVCILQPNNHTDFEADGYWSRWMKQTAVMQMAQNYGVAICDCCFTWPTPANPNDLAKYWIEDGVHMTAAGNELIFSRLEKVVNDLPFTRQIT